MSCSNPTGIVFSFSHYTIINQLYYQVQRALTHSWFTNRGPKPHPFVVHQSRPQASPIRGSPIAAPSLTHSWFTNRGPKPHPFVVHQSRPQASPIRGSPIAAPSLTHSWFTNRGPKPHPFVVHQSWPRALADFAFKVFFIISAIS